MVDKTDGVHRIGAFRFKRQSSALRFAINRDCTASSLLLLGGHVVSKELAECRFDLLLIQAAKEAVNGALMRGDTFLEA